MKLSDKQVLLSYFHNKATHNIISVCDVTGISFEIVAPMIPNIKGHCFCGLSPLANKEAAEQLALAKYSEAHYDLSASVLAGTLLSLFHHYKLREDHLSAVEANMILSQLPLFQLSQACNFLSNLSDWELKRIPHISLESGDPSTLKHWYLDCLRVLDLDNFEPIEIKQPQIKAKTFVDNSVSVEDRQAARAFLKTLKEASILPLKLSTIITMSIQKNNLAMISAELRKNIIAGLEKLGTPECLSLAAIFSSVGKNLTNSDAIVSKLLDEPASAFASISNAPSVRLSLAEIIAQKKQEAKTKPMDEALSLIEEIEAEGQTGSLSDDNSEEETIEEEFLADNDSNEAIMLVSDIQELDLESDDFISNEDNENFEASSPDMDALFDSEEEQS